MATALAPQQHQDKHSDLLSAMEPWAKLLGLSASLDFRNDGPEKNPINGAIDLTRQSGILLEGYLGSAPIMKQLPKHFSRISIHCSTRSITSAIHFDLNDRVVRFYKPDPNLPDDLVITDQSAKALGAAIFSGILKESECHRFERACKQSLPNHGVAEAFGADFAAWATYYCKNDTKQLRRRGSHSLEASRRIATAMEIVRPFLEQ